MKQVSFLLPGLMGWGRGNFIIDVDRYMHVHGAGQVLLADWPTEAEMRQALNQLGFKDVRKIFLTRPEMN